MDSREKKKSLFRAKLNEKQQKNRIDSPLVRYNEHDKPVCRVCDVVLKSDSDWIAHQASRKHNEAINNLKASASSKNVVGNTKPEANRELPWHQGNNSTNLNDAKEGMSANVQQSSPSAVLPANFFDSRETKRQKVGSAQEPDDANVGAASSKAASSSQYEIQPMRTAENMIASSETKQVKGALPEGFFDNKEADLRARGIEPVKPDVKDEYKEFEKLIQEDLAEVDNRLEEEEVDAAEVIEEETMVEQRTYKDRVELLKRKKLEIISARSSKSSRVPEVSVTKSDHQDGSSGDEDDDESFTVDWRAQHL